MPCASYAQVYVGNESDVAVWFDDVVVTHARDLRVQDQHYDPFGLDLVGVSRASD